MTIQEIHKFNRMSDLEAFIEEQKAKSGIQGIEKKEIEDSDFESLFGDLQSKTQNYKELVGKLEDHRGGVMKTGMEIGIPASHVTKLLGYTKLPENSSDFYRDPRVPEPILQRKTANLYTGLMQHNQNETSVKELESNLKLDLEKILKTTDSIEKRDKVFKYVQNNFSDGNLKESLLNSFIKENFRRTRENKSPASEDINNEANETITIDPIANILPEEVKINEINNRGLDRSEPESKKFKIEPQEEIVVGGQQAMRPNETVADRREEENNISLSLPGGDGTTEKNETGEQKLSEKREPEESEERIDKLDGGFESVNKSFHYKYDDSDKQASSSQINTQTSVEEKPADDTTIVEDGLTIDSVKSAPVQEKQPTVKPENKDINPVKMVTFDKFGNMIGGQTETTLPPKTEAIVKPITEPVPNTFKMSDKAPDENRNIAPETQVANNLNDKTKNTEKTPELNRSNFNETIDAIKQRIKPPAPERLNNNAVSEVQAVEPKKAGNLDHLDNDGILRSAQNDSLEANFQNDTKPTITKQPVVSAVETKPVEAQNEAVLPAMPELEKDIKENDKAPKVVAQPVATNEINKATSVVVKGETAKINDKTISNKKINLTKYQTREKRLNGLVDWIAKLRNNDTTSDRIAKIENQKKTLDLEAANNENENK